MADEEAPVVPAVRKVVEVALALVWRDDRLLITRRRLNTHLGGFWEFPGGKLQPGESPEACACREALEETGVASQAVRRRDPIEWTYPERTVRLYPIDCRHVSGEAQTLEVTDHAWVLPSELARYQFPPANDGLLAAIQSDSPPAEE